MNSASKTPQNNPWSTAGSTSACSKMVPGPEPRSGGALQALVGDPRTSARFEPPRRGPDSQQPGPRLWSPGKMHGGGRGSLNARWQRTSEFMRDTATGFQTESSNHTTISSTIVARPGTSSSISLGASCPSDCANGRTSSDQWDSVLLRFFLMSGEESFSIP
jgi:hypothetical protein